MTSHICTRPGNGISCCSAGFHFYKRQLDTFPDPQQAHARRGAHFTFDADGFVRAVAQIRYEGGCERAGGAAQCLLSCQQCCC